MSEEERPPRAEEPESPNDLDPAQPENEQPPPFDPDPDLITYIERGRKPPTTKKR